MAKISKSKSKSNNNNFKLDSSALQGTLSFARSNAYNQSIMKMHETNRNQMDLMVNSSLCRAQYTTNWNMKYDRKKMIKKQMIKDRDNLLSLLLSINYSSSNITDSSSYHDDNYHNHDVTNTLGSYGSANVKSLSDICIDTIAKNFDDYDTYMMKDFLEILLIPEFIEKILLLTCKHRTQTDINIECFMVDVVKRVYLSSAITNEMIVQCLCAKNVIINSSTTAQVVDSWETIDVSTYLLNEYENENDGDYHHRMEVNELYFIENKLSKHMISMIRKHQSSLQKLCFYDVSFDDDYHKGGGGGRHICSPYSRGASLPPSTIMKHHMVTTADAAAADDDEDDDHNDLAQPIDPFLRCLDILRLFSGHELFDVKNIGYNHGYDDDGYGRGSIFNNLSVLELHNCSWVDLRALEVWCHDIAHHHRSHSVSTGGGLSSEVMKRIHDDTDTSIHRSDHQHIISHDASCRGMSNCPSVLRRLKFINIYGYSTLRQSFAVDSSSGTDHHINDVLHPSCSYSDEVEHLVRLFESECCIKLTII